MQWTKAQRQAICDATGSTLVAAGAGSGKTAVLAERCVWLVAERVAADIDGLLVVTFTEAAAQEMRSRIHQRLVEIAARRPSPRLRRQIALLDAAKICTLHSFCLQVLKENFATLRIDPAVEVLDEDEATLVKEEVIHDLFCTLYEDDSQRGRQFADLVNRYGHGRDQQIAEQIIRLHDYLASLTPLQRKAWRQTVLEAYRLSGASSPAKALERFVEALCEQIAIMLEYHEVLLQAAEGKAAQTALARATEIHELIASLQRKLRSARRPADLGMLLDGILETVSEKFPQKPARAPQRYHEWVKWLHTAVKGHLAEQWLFDLDAWLEGLRQTAPYAQTLLHLADEFERRYTAAKRRLGKIDYSDMEQWAYAALADEAGNPSSLARVYQQRFEEVLVDEFQDINPVQAEILRLISRESSAAAKPNLFAVGDLRQSIYGFRMTEPALFARRQEDIANGRIRGRCIGMQENFRSRAEVLRFVNAAFARMMRADETDVGYDESAELKAALDYPAEKGPFVELHILHAATGKTEQENAEESDEDEAEDLEKLQREALLIATRIKQMVAGPPAERLHIHEKNDGQWQKRPAEYRDIVVLLRSPRHAAETFVEVFSRCGIPSYAEIASGYFESREVKDMLSLLEVLENMQQDIPLAAVLRSPLLGEPLTDADLAKIRTAQPDLPFHKAVTHYEMFGDDADLRKRVSERLGMIRRWRQEAKARPLAEVIADIYRTTGFVEYVSMLDGGIQRRANLLNLYERARQFATFSRQGLRRFVKFVREMIRSGREIATTSALPEAANVVRIMSIHASKGLEFPVVFVADLGRKFNDSDIRNSIVVDRDGLLGLEAVDPDRMQRTNTLPRLIAQERLRRKSRAEEMRVLYVAATRAKERLILVGTVARKDLDDWFSAQEELWSRHAGPLPRWTIRRANNYLDWVIPVALSLGPDIIKWHSASEVQVPRCRQIALATIYRNEDISRWQLPSRQGTASSREVMAVLDSMADAAPTDGDAAIAIARLSRPYRYAELTRTPAVAAASELKGRVNWSEDEEAPSGVHWPRIVQYRAAAFGTPRRLRAAVQPERARQRGTATHMFLQHLDIGGACDAADLRRQLERLVEANILTAQEAETVDLEGICWLLNETPLGRILRENRTTLRREVPFVLRIEPHLIRHGSGSDDPADAVLIRGIIDAMWTTGEAIEIADYKTDAVSGQHLLERIELYKDQLRVYAEAARRIWAKPVERAYIVFLAARHIEPFVPKPLTA